MSLDWIREHWVWKPYKKVYDVSKLTNKLITTFYIRCPHHLYIGGFLLLMGWMMEPYELYDIIKYVFYAAGGLIAADDIIEHTMNKDTPLRMFFEKIIVRLLKR